MGKRKHIGISLESIIANSPQFIFWKSIDSIYLGCNDNFAHIAGFKTPKEIIGKTDYDLPWAETASIYLEEDKKVIETGKPLEQRETPLITYDKKNIIILVSKSPLFDAKGEVAGILGIYIDITERKQYEAMLKKAKEQAEAENKAKIEFLAQLNREVIGTSIRLNSTAEDYANAIRHHLESIIAAMPGNVYWTDTNFVCLGCNDNIVKSLGMKSRQDVIGKSYDELAKLSHWPEDIWQSFKKVDFEVITTGIAKENIEEPVVHDHNGHEQYFLSSRKPLIDKGGKVTGIVGISIDITNRKQMERALREAKDKAEAANKVKTEFIANMSHDIRTPLTGVIGLSNILELEGDTQKDRELAHSIHVSSESLLQLLNDVLEVVSADEIQKNNFNLATFNLRARLTFIENLLVSNTQQHHVKLIFNLGENLPEYVVCDRVKVERILLNLISNAMKFTPSGTIIITVSVLDETEQETTLRFKISDTGIGIPPDQIDKIFDRFYRIDPSYHNKYKGHGIGLFIVRKYVDLLKGKITVESEMGKGTTFVVDLPVKIDSALDSQTGEEMPDMSHLIESSSMRLIPLENALANTIIQPKTIETEGAFKVLVIEDDAIARRVVKSMLTGAGFEVEDAEDAEQGFGQVMRNSYDLILTDIGLPLMNGIEFTKTVRAWEKITSHAPTPIVGLTAHGKSQQETAYEAGMNMLFSKPLNEQKLQTISKSFFIKTPEYSEVITSTEKKPTGLGYDLPATEKELFELDIYPILDEKEGIESLGGDLNFFKEIVVMLIEQTIPEELPLLIKAHDEGDWEQVQSIAHKLKGAALYCGTIRLRYACQYTERYRLAGHSELLEPLYQQLLVVVGATINYLKEWLMRKGIG